MKQSIDLYSAFCETQLPVGWTKLSDVSLFKWAKAMGVNLIEITSLWNRAKASAYVASISDKTKIKHVTRPAILMIASPVGATGYFRQFPQSYYLSRHSASYRVPMHRYYRVGAQSLGGGLSLSPTPYDQTGFESIAGLDDPTGTTYEKEPRQLSPLEIIEFNASLYQQPTT